MRMDRTLRPQKRKSFAAILMIIFSLAVLPGTGSREACAQTIGRLGSTLEVGASGSFGIATDGRMTMGARLDLGGALRTGWDYGRFEIVVGAGGIFTGEPNFNVDFARAQLIRLAHFHALGIERDVRNAVQLGVEAVGFYLPVRLYGSQGDSSWALLRFGGDLHYQWISQRIGALTESHGAAAVLVVRADQQLQLTRRLTIRTFAEASYTGFIGSASRLGEVTVGHRFVLDGGAQLALDVTPSDPVRSRMYPMLDGTEARHERAVSGPRLRILLVNAVGEWRAFDSIGGGGSIVSIGSGIEYVR